jgi:hypothetical protein
MMGPTIARVATVGGEMMLAVSCIPEASETAYPIPLLADRPGFAREDVPLPSKPPYTAFVGNLAFDLGEDDIANHFSDLKVRYVLAASFLI